MNREIFILYMEELMWELLDEYDLSHGNADVYFEGNDLYVTVETPNNFTNTVSFEELEIPNEWTDEYEKDIEDRFIKKVRELARDFDVDEVFNEYWSREFGEHNNFTPTQFLEMLQEDKKFLESL